MSGRLRKEREFSFYGDIDFIPTERQTAADAARAIDDAAFVVSVAERVIRTRFHTIFVDRLTLAKVD